MNALLVYPRYPNTFWSFRYALKVISKRALYPPLGLLTVAAMLPADWNKKLVDLNVTTLTDDDLGWADLVFISAMDVQIDSVKDVVARCQQIGVEIVAGGPLFTMRHEEFTDIDYFVLGEAEDLIGRFISDMAQGNAQRVYSSDERPDISRTPLPLWSLVDMKQYACMCIQYSRGCPFDCEFCDIVMLNGHQPRTKTETQVIAELESLYSNGWRGAVFFVDDNFIGNKKKLKEEILPAVAAWSGTHDYPFSFSTQASINLGEDTGLMTQMVDAGFNRVLIGIETPHVESLEGCNKLHNARTDLVETIKRIYNYGLEVQGSFIIGFDADPPDIFDQQIAFIQKSGIVTAMVNLLCALHGTKLYQRLVRENRLLGEPTGDSTSGSTNFVTKMNYETLQKGYKRVLSTIYSPENFYGRVHAFYREFRPRATHTKMQLGSLVWLIKSFVIVGVWESGRTHYWKLLISTLMRYPRFFLPSVKFSIYRLHFQKLIQKLYMGSR